MRIAISLPLVAAFSLFFGFSKTQADSGGDLSQIRLTAVEFNETDLATALDYLRSKANELRGPKAHPANLILIDPDDEIAEKQISLKLKNIPWSHALKYTCELAGVSFVLDDSGVIVIGNQADIGHLRHSRSKILESAGSRQLKSRIANRVMNEIDLKGAHLDEIVEFLSAATEPAKKSAASPPPLNFLIKENAKNSVAERTVNLRLNRVQVTEVLHYITGLAGCRYRIDPKVIVIGDAEDLAHIPQSKVQYKGEIYQKLLKTQVEAVEIVSGTPVEDIIELIRQKSVGPGFPDGINLVDSIGEDRETWSLLKLQKITLMDLLRYLNEVSGTIFRIEQNAVVILDDPKVTETPASSLLKTTESTPGKPVFDN